MTKTSGLNALALSDGIARDILEGQKILEALADQDDTDRLVKSGLAYAYWRLGRTDDVVHLTDDMPTNSVEGRFGLWVRLNALADAYRFKEALYVGQRLQKLSPQDVQLRMLVSRLHGNLGHWDKALKAAAQGVRDAPPPAEGWYLRFQANPKLGHQMRKRSMNVSASATRSKQPLKKDVSTQTASCCGHP